jgi:hypothetical protein
MPDLWHQQDVLLYTNVDNSLGTRQLQEVLFPGGILFDRQVNNYRTSQLDPYPNTFALK